MFHTLKIPVSTTGGAGVSVGTGYSARPVNGVVRAMYVDWHTDAPATADMDVTFESDSDHSAITIYSKSNSKTDAWVYPHVQATGTDGAAITGWYAPVAGSGRIKVAIAQCDDLSPAATVYVLVEE